MLFIAQFINIPFISFWQALREEYWQRRHMVADDEEDRLYWEERRRYEEDYMEWCRRGNMGPFPRGRPLYPGNVPPAVSTARWAPSGDTREWS